MSKIKIKEIEITISNELGEDYINLTDMVKAEGDGEQLIKKWLSTKNTIEYLGVWESYKNAESFNYTEFGLIKNEAGSNKFTMSAKQWKERTNGIGIRAKAGRYGSGTYAHKDIALKFAAWISPELELLIILEFQRLKKEEAERLETGWDYRRFLAKTNYTIHTDAIKDYIIPELTEAQAKFAYANEADMLNVALFGNTAKQWKEKNPKYALEGLNMRDLADVHQLMVLSNLENNNAYLISKGLTQSQRLLELRKTAVSQLNSLRKSAYTIEKIQSPFKQISHTGTPSPKKESSGLESYDLKINKAIKKGKPD